MIRKSIYFGNVRKLFPAGWSLPEGNFRFLKTGGEQLKIAPRQFVFVKVCQTTPSMGLIFIPSGL